MTISKVVDARGEVSVIRNGDVVASSGYGGHGVAEGLLVALENRFLEEEQPRDLTLVWAGGQGDGAERGLNHLGHEGLLKRTIGGHYGLLPKITKLAVNEKVEAYNFPEGVLVHLYRSIASGSPGILTTVGIGTFVDPRVEGAKVNASAVEDLVELSERGADTWLFYPAIPIDVAIIRGTTADPLGNVTIEREAASLEILELAMAARASGGHVICQVERIAASGSLDSRDVRVPGFLVDAVVVAEAGLHMQTWDIAYDPSLSGELKVPPEPLDPLPLDVRTVVARRAALELEADAVVNVGVGLPELVGRVAGDEGIEDLVTFTVDTGVTGGIPLSDFGFGASVNRQAVLDHAAAFDFIDGGGLDAAFLGVAECDRFGNVNVSRFGGHLAGAGGAINLTQKTDNVVFMTPFSTGGLDAVVEDGYLLIRNEGRFSKFVEDVGQITFSSAVARDRSQNITYVTERCVFRLGEAGLALTEIAPGIDIESDILTHLPFEPEVNNPEMMDKVLFHPGQIGLRDRLLSLSIEDRLTYDSKSNTVFMDYAGMHVRSQADVSRIITAVDALLGQVGHRVYSVVNYDRFQLDEAATDAYADAVRYVQQKYYIEGGVTRHSTNAFIRLKLGRELEKRKLDPSIYETVEETEIG
jgi:propionate CoA-transferase